MLLNLFSGRTVQCGMFNYPVFVPSVGANNVQCEYCVGNRVDSHSNIIVDAEMCVMTDGHVLACPQVCQWNELCDNKFLRIIVQGRINVLLLLNMR